VKIRVLNELLLIIILTVLLGIIVYFSPSSILRVIFGLPALLFFPGYALLSALFPARDALHSLEWAAFSLAVSIAAVSLIGIILNYTPWGITLHSALLANAGFIIAAAALAWLRRYRINATERGIVQFNIKLPFDQNQNTADKIISIILALAVLGAAGTLVYDYAAPQTGEKYTDFYILGPDGRATDYTRDLAVGWSGRVVVGIINHEQEPASYRVAAKIDGRDNAALGPVTLNGGEKWEGEMAYTADRAGKNQPLEFYLYKNGSAQPSLKPLRLWINILPP
jgi:uncharacterized membrane protein